MQSVIYITLFLSSVCFNAQRPLLIFEVKCYLCTSLRPFMPPYHYRLLIIIADNANLWLSWDSNAWSRSQIQFEDEDHAVYLSFL